MKELTGQELPRSMGSDWTELTFLQLQAGNTAIYVFALAVVFASWCWRRSTRAGRCR